MAFKGHRVMLSRSLVAPEIFDMLHGVLKENGAEVCLCSNPEYNSSTDFHVLSSWESVYTSAFYPLLSGKNRRVGGAGLQ
ncbi:unnamed protein product [Calypogeia fissa]